MGYTQKYLKKLEEVINEIEIRDSAGKNKGGGRIPRTGKSIRESIDTNLEGELRGIHQKFLNIRVIESRFPKFFPIISVK